MLATVLQALVASAFCPAQPCSDPSEPCTVVDKVWVCTQSLVLQSAVQVAIRNSSIYCYNPAPAYPDCSFNITAPTVDISQDSLLYAALIDIRATENITVCDSVLTTNGTGNLAGPGQCLDKGASHGGRGGGNCRATCGDLCYGDYLLPYEYGAGYSAVSRGGGIVALTAPLIIIGGEISAGGDLDLDDSNMNPSGLNYTSNTQGGSGGSVFLNATEVQTCGSVVLTVAGGVGGINSYSGGGGRVAVYGSVPPLAVVTIGPSSPDPYRLCASGGAGTYYSDISKTIFVNNGGIRTENLTPLSTDGTLSLQVTNGAAVSPFYIEEVLNATSISLESAFIEAACDHDPNNFTSFFELLIYSPSIELADSSVIGTSNANSINITSEIITIDLSSGIIFGGVLEIRTMDLLLEGEIEGNLMAEYPTIAMIYARNASMLSEAIVKANFVGVVTEGDLFLQGAIQTPGSSCQVTSALDPPFPCQAFEVGDLWDVISSNFTLFAYSSTSIIMSQNAKVIGSRVGLCSASLQIAGTVSALGYGCLGNEGPGKGEAIASQCAATGAGYGGRGGAGAPLNVTANCSSVLPGAEYGLSNAPWLEGSGGGGIDSEPGAGGGLIILETAHLSLNGTVTAGGEDAPPTSTREGAGGGSGGSVYVHIRVLEGTGTITAAGGSGAGRGGGGGGGRVLLNWTSADSISDPLNAQNWFGAISASGGKATSPAGTGQPGSLNSAACAPGYEGVLCSACPVGHYKPGTQYQESCQRCSNKPRSAHYKDTGGTSKDCPYACPKWFTDESDNPSCESPISELFNLVGGTGPGFGVLAAVIAAVSASVTVIYAFKLIKRRQSLMRHLLKPMLMRSPNRSCERKMPLPKTEQPETTREALPFHLLRVYFLGDNTYNRPWGLPIRPYPQLDAEVQPQEYMNFALRINRMTRWRLWEHSVLRILEVVYPPLDLVWLTYRRRRKYEKVRSFVQTYSESLWKKLELRQLSDSLRVSHTSDYTVAAIDVICPTRRVEEWDERPHLPTELLTTGYGTFDFPFHFPMNDLMVEYLSWAVRPEHRNDYYHFLVRLNSLAREVSCERPLIDQLDFTKIEDLVQRFNKQYLADCDYQFIPCVFQCSIHSNGGLHDPPLPILQSSNMSNVHIGKSQPSIVACSKLGLVLAELKTEGNSFVAQSPVSEGYWEPVALDATSESLLANNGIQPCRRVAKHAGRKCSLNSFLQGRLRPYWVLWLCSLTVLSTCDLAVFALLMIELCTARDITGILLCLLIVPGAAVISPIITLLSLSHAKTIRYTIKFQIAGLYYAAAALAYTAGSRHYYSWTIVMAVDLVLKIAIVKLAAIHSASLSQLRPWKSQQDLEPPSASTKSR